MSIRVEILGRLRTETLPSGKLELLTPLIFTLNGVRSEVAKGFVSDYSSFPWYSRWIVRWSKVAYAGMMHDWLLDQYYKGLTDLSRSDIDEIWRVTARLGGDNSASAWQAWLSWSGIRINSIFQEIIRKYA